MASKWVRLIVPAGKASAQPPVGPVLGSNGVKAIDFAKQFNARTTHVLPDVPLPVKVFINADRSFNFDIKTPHTTWLLKKAAGIEKGSTRGSETVGTVSMKQIYHIAEIKMAGVEGAKKSNLTLEAIARSICGTCKSMGLKVVK